MRDPARIDRFCNELKAIWHCVPDWRFGQLMSNMLGFFVHSTGRDIFFPEDDELIGYFREYITQTGSPYKSPDEIKEILDKEG